MFLIKSEATFSIGMEEKEPLHVLVSGQDGGFNDFEDDSPVDIEAGQEPYFEETEKVAPVNLIRGPSMIVKAFLLFSLPLLFILALLIVICIAVESCIPAQSLLKKHYNNFNRFNVSQERAQIPVFNRYLEKIDSVADYNIRLDGHSHTIDSDGWMSPKELLDWAISCDYNAIIVSDHNSWNGGLNALKVSKEPAYKDQILVIPAMEFTCCRIHLNIINVQDTAAFNERLKNTCAGVGACGYPSDADLQQLIQATHDLGGYVVLNHFPWSNKMEMSRGHNTKTLQNHPSIEQLIDWGIDGLEICNGDTIDLPGMLQFQDNRKLIFITGSDVHQPTPAYSWTLIKSTEFTRESVLSSLFSSSSNALFQFIPQGTKYPTDPPFEYKSGGISKIFIDFGRLFKYSLFVGVNQGMYSFSNDPKFCHATVVNYYIWSICLFIIFIFSWIGLSFIIFYHIYLNRQQFTSK